MAATAEIVKPKLGEGFYTAPDIALILNLPYRKVRYWFDEYVKTRLENTTNFRYYFSSDNHDAVNFYSLIEAYVFYQFKELGYKTKKIIEAHGVLSEWYNTPYPFAKIETLGNGGEILYKPESGEDVLITADKRQQYKIKEVIAPFTKKIDFGKQNKLAELFYPLGRDKSVVVNPKNQFGQPIIKGTNILAETIFDYYKAGATVADIANMFELQKSSIKDAIDFVKEAKVA